MCVLVTFDINLAIKENILRDHHESGVIKYAWTSTILGIYKYGSCIANKVLHRGYTVDMGGNVFFTGITAVLCYWVSFFQLIIMRLPSLKYILKFSWRQDCTLSTGEFVMETHGSKHYWKGISNSYEQGRARIVVLPMRRELSWKKRDPPYRLMDVLASALSDQLSCWLHQRV